MDQKLPESSPSQEPPGDPRQGRCHLLGGDEVPHIHIPRLAKQLADEALSLPRVLAPKHMSQITDGEPFIQRK